MVHFNASNLTALCFRICILKRKGRQDDCPGRYWIRWRQASTTPVTTSAAILTTIPFLCVLGGCRWYEWNRLLPSSTKRNRVRTLAYLLGCTWDFQSLLGRLLTSLILHSRNSNVFFLRNYICIGLCVYLPKMWAVKEEKWLQFRHTSVSN